MRWIISHFFPQVHRAGFSYVCALVFSPTCFCLASSISAICIFKRHFSDVLSLMGDSNCFCDVVAACRCRRSCCWCASKSGMFWILLWNVSVSNSQDCPTSTVAAGCRSSARCVVGNCNTRVRAFEHLRTGFMFLFQFRFLLHFIFLEFISLPRNGLAAFGCSCIYWS